MSPWPDGVSPWALLELLPPPLELLLTPEIGASKTPLEENMRCDRLFRRTTWGTAAMPSS
jgi:hypothetical protein